jgi:hypothetical protein
MEQYFSLTANQPQPVYKPKKQPAEQGLRFVSKDVPTASYFIRPKKDAIMGCVSVKLTQV